MKWQCGVERFQERQQTFELRLYLIGGGAVVCGEVVRWWYGGVWCGGVVWCDLV